MKKNATKKYLKENGEKTARYIIAHAKLQKMRGHNPSESYKDQLNPLHALRLAISEEFGAYKRCSNLEQFKVISNSVIKVNPTVGSDIRTSIAPMMIAVANATGFLILFNYKVGKFQLTIDNSWTVDKIVKEWYRQIFGD